MIPGEMQSHGFELCDPYGHQLLNKVYHVAKTQTRRGFPKINSNRDVIRGFISDQTQVVWKGDLFGDTKVAYFDL